MSLPSVLSACLLSMLFAVALHAEVTTADFGTTRDGSAVRLFTITNKSGASVSIMTYGAAVQSLRIPDRSGQLGDVVLGYDDFAGYMRNDPFFGAIAGRYANRIRGAAFSLNGIEYKITANDRGNTLHGGKRGFDKVIWAGAVIDNTSVQFTYVSKDGEEGFPGNLTAHVQYTLTDANELKIEYSATTDKDTVLNLTNHSYFNLAGAGNGDVLNHELAIFADRYTPTDRQLIPTGVLADVAGTPFDFREAHKIGDKIGADEEVLHIANGYDQNFVLNRKDGLGPAATVYEPTSGRVMEVSTTEPGVQLYTGNGLDGSITGKDGKQYLRHGAFCLETQHFPDSPNHPEFPTTELKAGQTFHSTTVYKFTTRGAAPPAIHLETGWSTLQEGVAVGFAEQDAKNPRNPSPHLLRIVLTKTAGPGEGRAGAISSVHFAVEAGAWWEVKFSAVTGGPSVGLVFSLENSDGKVLARTTLPEVGGGRRGRRRGPPAPTTLPTTWTKYLVSLHVRASDPSAHVVITPIEQTIVWLDGLTLTPRILAN